MGALDKAMVDKIIVEHVLPQAYTIIDDLLDHVDHKKLPKELLIRAKRILPGWAPHSFEHASYTKADK